MFPSDSKHFEMGTSWRGGGKDMLTMSVVLRPDITSLLWPLIGPHVNPHSYLMQVSGK